MALQEQFEKQGTWLFKYRGFLPLIALLIGAIMYLRTEIYPETFFLEGTPYEFYYDLFCIVISLLGFVIRIYTVGYTPKNTSGRNVETQVADSLNTTGIYSIVRHPLYLGNFFMWLGPALITGNYWFVLVFCLAYWIYYERIMFAEEQFLRRKFGDIYTSWAETVPAFFPKFRLFKKKDSSFNWKKVVKNEKNGLVAIFLIFCTFDVLGKLITKDENYNFGLIFISAFTILLYLIIKYMKKKTHLLDEN
jgi:protein-S-isoprenylcysteine O-methyltransferase Ste14